MSSRVALLTHARQFAGPGVVRALADAGFEVICHDRSFAEPDQLAGYQATDARLTVIAEQDAEKLVDAAIERFGHIDLVVSNDMIASQLYGPPPQDAVVTAGDAVFRQVNLEDATVEEFRATLEALVVRPFALSRAVLPSMKARGSGTIIFITSSMSGRANPMLQMASAARTAATNLAQSLAHEVGPDGVHVFVIGPAWFDNPTYYPAAYRDAFMPGVERDVPLRRLGSQEEMGALVAYLASGKAAPLIGQYLGFTAGLAPGY